MVLRGSPQNTASICILTRMHPHHPLGMSSPVLFVEFVLDVPRHLGLYGELVERTGRNLLGKAGIRARAPQAEASMTCSDAGATALEQRMKRQTAQRCYIKMAHSC